MRILIDTNVVLDWLLRREPHYNNAKLILHLSEKRQIHGFISASAITDVFYTVSKVFKSKEKARELLNNLFGAINIAMVDDSTIKNAFNLEWRDFEDSVQYMVGKNIDANYIVTRNANDFANSKIKAISPEDLLNIIAPR